MSAAANPTFLQLGDGLLDLFIAHRVPRAGWLVYAAFERGRNLRQQLTIGDVARRCQLTIRNAREAAERLVELGALDATHQQRGLPTIYEVAEPLYTGAFWQVRHPRQLAEPQQEALPMEGLPADPPHAEAPPAPPVAPPAPPRPAQPKRTKRTKRALRVAECVAVSISLINRWGEADGGQTLWIEFAGVPPAETRTFLKTQSKFTSIPLGDGKYRWVALASDEARAALARVNPTGAKHVTGIDEAAAGWERRPTGVKQVSSAELATVCEREAAAARERAGDASNSEWRLLYAAVSEKIPDKAAALFGQLYGVGWDADSGLLRLASADEMTCLLAEQYGGILQAVGAEVFGRDVQLAIAFVPEIGSDKFVSIESLRAKDRRRA